MVRVRVVALVVTSLEVPREMLVVGLAFASAERRRC
jgi:hypothetical protein